MFDAKFREMQKKDLDKIFEIEHRSFITPWSYNSLKSEFKNKLAFYGVAETDTSVVAYAGMWMIFDEAHITNVAVEPEARGIGIGKDLMRFMMDNARLKGASKMTLEVREKNFVAQNMYSSLGFIKEGTRKRYYTDTGEDAYILWVKL
ncbi:MAG: ribosomal protein S18-alanine N-acetyltransferase [Clostridia bacterium]